MKKFIVCVTVLTAVFTAVSLSNKKQNECILKALYPMKMNITDVLTIKGTVVENEKKNIHVNGNAVLKEVYVKTGDTVKKDDLLARIEKTERFTALNIPADYIADAVLQTEAGDAVYYDTDYFYIRSPIDGTVMSVNYKENESVSPVVPIITVSDLTNLGITAQVQEDVVHKISEGMTAKIVTSVKDAGILSAEVTQIKPYAIKTSNFLTNKDNPAKTTVKLDIKDETKDIKPGYSVSVKLITDERAEALTLPYQYICQNEENKQYVYVLSGNGTPEIRFIETGYELETVCEVRSGLSETDLVLMPDNIDTDKTLKIKVANENG